LSSKVKKSDLTISIVIAIIIHAVIILVCSFIFFNSQSETDPNEIFLNLVQYDREIKSVNKSDETMKEIVSEIIEKEDSENIISVTEEVIESEIITEVTDSNKITKKAGLEHQTEFTDSIVISFPSLLTLKYALSERIKNEPAIETDSALIVRRLRKYMSDHYKYKYPTPLSEFGEGNTGIPIDKILDLFSGEDDIDEKKIREYLKLDK
jgi:hypothetical protein